MHIDYLMDFIKLVNAVDEAVEVAEVVEVWEFKPDNPFAASNAVVKASALLGVMIEVPALMAPAVKDLR